MPQRSTEPTYVELLQGELTASLREFGFEPLT